MRDCETGFLRNIFEGQCGLRNRDLAESQKRRHQRKKEKFAHARALLDTVQLIVERKFIQPS